ncbi:MAG TPA: hypothetical protein VIH17_09835 [Candidatus Acidoferrales bacterium]
MSCTKCFWVAVGIVVTLLFVFLPSAEAGPPLICWPYEIGGAKSLPWGVGSWRAIKADYDVNRLVEDTLALLTPDAPVIVRMETLRRATVYAMKDPRIRQALLSRLLRRAQQAEGKGNPDAMAFFDAGYLVEAYKQADWAFGKGNPAKGLDGYGMVLKAARHRANDPEMEFAAAVISLEPRLPGHAEHLQRAVAGATDGSLLAKNLVSHSHLLKIRGHTVAELRASVRNWKH